MWFIIFLNLTLIVSVMTYDHFFYNLKDNIPNVICYLKFVFIKSIHVTIYKKYISNQELAYYNKH